MCTHFSCLWSSPSSLLTPSYIVFNIPTFLIHIYYPTAFWMMLRFSFSWQCLLYLLMNFHVLIPNIYAMFANEIVTPFPTFVASIPHLTPQHFPCPVSHSWVSPYFYHPGILTVSTNFPMHQILNQIWHWKNHRRFCYYFLKILFLILSPKHILRHPPF